MVLNGFKRPLVQKDMWELSEAESTLQISQRFQQTMQTELEAARTRLQAKMRKRGEEKASKGQGEGLQIGHQNSLGKGVSQDVLMMVRATHTRTKMQTHKKHTQKRGFISFSLSHSQSLSIWLISCKVSSISTKQMFSPKHSRQTLQLCEQWSAFILTERRTFLIALWTQATKVERYIYRDLTLDLFHYIRWCVYVNFNKCSLY